MVNQMESTVNLLDPEVAKLAKILNTTDSDKRISSYVAIATLAIKHYGLQSNMDGSVSAGFKVSARNLVYRINEVGIIDKDLLNQVIDKMAKVKVGALCSAVPSNNFAINKFNDLLGIDQFVGNTIVDAMEKEISTFRDTMHILPRANIL